MAQPRPAPDQPPPRPHSAHHPFRESLTPAPLEREEWRQRRRMALRAFAPELRDVADLPREHPVFVYGTGNGGRALARALAALPELAPAGFIDSFRSGEFEGLPVHAVTDFVEAFRGRWPTVVIASCYVDEIAETLVDAGLPRFYDASELVRALIAAPIS